MKQPTPGSLEPPERPSPREGAGKRLKVCGASAPGTPTLYIPKALLEEVIEYAGGDRRRPRGGFIMGYPGRWKGERYVELRAHVPAVDGIGDGVKFLFTQKAFEDLAAQGTALWPDAKVVGWYYTHLNSGIFLSGSDVQLHRTYFDGWWQFAFVLDPIQGSLGFFVWKETQLLPSGFTIVEAT